MNRHQVLRIQQRINHCVQKMIADIFSVFCGALRNACKSESGLEIAACKIMCVRNQRQQLALCPENGSCRRTRRPNIGNNEPYFDWALVVAVPESRPALLSNSNN